MHRQLVKTVSEASPWVLAGLSRSCRLITAPLQIIATSLQRFYYPLDSLDLKLPTDLQKTPPCTLPNPLCCLFVCLLLDLFCLYVLHPVSTTPFYSTVLPHHFLFSFLFSHSLPLCLLQLNKQTNPLPLDTQLRRGDLLCLSGRILSDTVAPVNKRKAPEARGAALFVRRVDYLPHTPFCLFSLSGV